MENFLLRKLAEADDLDEADRQAVEQLFTDVRRFEPKEEIIGQGERPEYVHLMMEGWAARYKSLPDGSRQIVGFLIPGDFCDLHIQILGAMDHSIVALGRCAVAFVPGSAFDRLIEQRTRLARALWWATLVDEAVLREWLLNAGRRGAYRAAAHLLCEMHFRMNQVGLVEDGHGIFMPMRRNSWEMRSASRRCTRTAFSGVCVKRA